MAQAGKTKKIFDGRYEILEIVGRGERSVVYRARHVNNTSIEVALKVLVDKDGQPSYLEKLKKEALAMVSSRHQYVIRLDDFHSVGKLSYFTMEFAPLGDLGSYATKLGGKIVPEQAALFLEQAALAMSQIHRAGIVHRDIKLENILVISDTEIRVGDFGLAVLPGEPASMQELETGVGTMNYMAPEVLEGKEYSFSSDLYALGVSFYQAITGSNPFASAPLVSQLAVREDHNVPHLRSLVPGCPRYLADAVMKLMSFEPFRRFSSADELAQHIQAHRSPSTAPASAERDQGERATRSWMPFRKKIPEGAKRFRLRDKKSVTQDPIPAHLGYEASAALSTPEPTDEPAFIAPPEPDTRSAEEVARQALYNFSQMDSAALQAEVPADVTPQMNDDLYQQTTPPTSDPLAFNEPATTDYSDVASTDSSSVVDTLVNEPVDEVRAVADEVPQSAGRVTGDAIARDTALIDSSSYQEIRELDAATRHRENRVPVKRFFLTISIAVFLLVLFTSQTQIGSLLYHRLGLSSLFASFTLTSTSTKRDAIDFDPIPRKPFEFPFLPRGWYIGEISGVLPGATHQLSIVSLPENRQIVFIIGIPGWTPLTLDVSAAYAAIARGSPVRSITVASNGVVLALTGGVVDGELVGYVKNIITGEKGEWRATPQYEK